jgi:response regulator of citrate/malate metabolism
MKMKLKPFKELIGLSKEKLDEALAPMRARQVKAQAELEQAKIDEQLISTESRMQEVCSQKAIDFPTLLRLMDEYALAERRKKQYTKIINELFPSD